MCSCNKEKSCCCSEKKSCGCCNGKGCNCCEESCSSSCGSCGSGSCKEGKCDFTHKLLELADEAWMCLLKEKIRNQIESHCGSQLDELAKIISDSNKDRWQHKMAKDKACKEFKHKVCDFFHHNCDDGSCNK